KRYGSASQLAEDLRCFVTGRPPAHAELDGVLERVQSVMRRRIAKVLFGLAALITVAISLAIFLTAHPKSPNTGPLAKINRDLDNGITVTLIGERGLPDYFQWRSDDLFGKVTEARDGSFSIQHFEYGRVEILSNPRVKHYRIRAKAR